MADEVKGEHGVGSNSVALERSSQRRGEEEGELCFHTGMEDSHVKT